MFFTYFHINFINEIFNMNLILLQKNFFKSKDLKQNSIPVNEILSQLKPTLCT